MLGVKLIVLVIMSFLENALTEDFHFLDFAFELNHPKLPSPGGLLGKIKGIG